MKNWIGIWYLAISGLILIPTLTLAGNVVSPQIKIFDHQGSLKSDFIVLDGNSYQGNVDLALADVDGDSQLEIIISSGSGNNAKVEIWEGSGKKLSEFLAFPESFRGGAFVSAGDINSDNKAEIIVGAGYRGGPQVRGFYNGGENFVNFFSGDKEKRSGIKVLLADLDGSKISKVITGSNLNQPARISIYDNWGKLLKEKSFDFNNFGGINLARLPSVGGKDSILVAGGYGNKPEIRILDSNLDEANRFMAFDEKYNGGVNISAGDLNGDGNSEIVAGPSFHGYSLVRIFDINGVLQNEFKPYDFANYLGGIKTAVGDIDGDGEKEIVTLPERIFDSYRSSDYKFIDVDLDKQVLTYWQDGRRLDSFLISSGLPSRPTPKGVFSIFKKRPKVWMFGADYNLPNVPWVASFKGAYTIHGTYWHNNFGHRMSHGCINMFTPHAKLIYDWVDIGTKVIIY